VHDEGVELLEGALVEQQLHALVGSQLVAGVLAVDARLSAAEPGQATHLAQPLDARLGRRSGAVYQRGLRTRRPGAGPTASDPERRRSANGTPGGLLTPRR